jgi:hypothetical protein
MALEFDKKGYIKASIQGRNGHTTQTSIMELVQNSLDAKSTEIRINYDNINNRLFIIDNGLGMDYSTLQQMSVLYYHKNKEENIHGKFGIGAKHAWLLFGGHWYILSKTNENNNIACLEWNVEKLIEWAYDDEMKYNNFIDVSKNCTEEMKSIYNEYKIKSKSGTIIMCQLPDKYKEEEEDFKNKLDKSVHIIQMKNQQKNADIYYCSNGNPKEYIKIEKYNWLCFNNVISERKLHFKLYVIKEKNKFLYYINFNGKNYKYLKKHKKFEYEKNMFQKLNRDNAYIMNMNITFLNEKQRNQQCLIKYGNSAVSKNKIRNYNLSGVLINRNNHYVYTETTLWPLELLGSSNMSHFYDRIKKFSDDLILGFRFEIEYKSTWLKDGLDNIFGIKSNKSNFNYQHVDQKFRDMINLLTLELISFLKIKGFKNEGLKHSLIQTLSQWEIAKEKKEQQKLQEEKEREEKQREKEQKQIQKQLEKERKKQEAKLEKQRKKQEAELEKQRKKQEAELEKQRKKQEAELEKQRKKQKEELELELEEERVRIRFEELQEKKEKAKLEKQQQKQQQEHQQQEEQFELIEPEETIEISSDDSITDNVSPDFFDIIGNQNIDFRIKGNNIVFEPCNLSQLKFITRKLFKPFEDNQKIIPNSVKVLESLHQLYKSMN